MSKEELHEDISEEEFIKILQTGEIKMKRLTVGGHSKLDGLELKWTSLPREILMGPLIRKEQVILPDGDTKLKHGDIIIIFGKEKDLEITKELLAAHDFITQAKRSVQRFLSKIKTRKLMPGAEESSPGEKEPQPGNNQPGKL